MWDLIFAKKPEKSILNKLGFEKAAGFDESFDLKAILVKKKIGKKPGFLISRVDEVNTRYLIERSLVDAVICDFSLDLASIQLAAENRIAVVFNFNDILKTKGIKRSKAIHKMRHNAILAKKYGCDIIVCSGAENEDELTSASDLIGFAEYLGFSRGEAKLGLSKVYEKVKEREK